MGVRNIERLQGSEIYSNLKGNFTAAYQSASSIRVTGSPFVPAASQVVKIMRWDKVAAVYNPISVELNSVAITAGVGYFDISFAGYTLEADDIFEVEITGTAQGYSVTEDAIQVTVQNVDGATADVFPLIPIVNTTNILSTGAAYYPSALGLKMEVGNKNLSVWDYCNSAITMSVEVAPTNAFTSPIVVQGYNITDNSTASTWVVSASPVRIDYEMLGGSYYRIKALPSSGVNTVLIYENQW